MMSEQIVMHRPLNSSLSYVSKRGQRNIWSDSRNVSCLLVSGVESIYGIPSAARCNVLNAFGRVKFKKDEMRWRRTEVMFEISAIDLL